MRPDARNVQSETTNGEARNASAGGSVLFLAQLPPPHHGQSAVAETVHGILGGDAGLDVIRKWRGGAADAGDVGKRRLGKYFGFALLILEILWMLVTNRRFQLAYLGMAPWAHTAVRDAILAGLAKLVAKRTWLHVHGDGLEPIVNATSFKNKLIRRLISGTELIAITQDTVRIGTASGVFSRVIDLPNIAADPGTMDPAPHRPLTVGCLGNLDPRKGVLDFVASVAMLTKSDIPVTATIVGGPTAHLSAEDLREKISKVGLSERIDVTGRVSEEIKSDILAGQDIFLYLSRHDLAPIALIEALAHGAAPIVLDVGGLREMVGPEFKKNVLSPELSQDALLDEIKRIVDAYQNNPDLLRDDKIAARARYLQAFSPQRYRAQILKQLARGPAGDHDITRTPVRVKAEMRS